MSLNDASREFMLQSAIERYSYNFEWFGRPIIQYPQDIVAFQDIVFRVSPDLIIETGIAHGGSLILSASLLCLLDVMEGLDPRKSGRSVVGIDVDIRPHNRRAIDEHPLRFKIDMIEGSSCDDEVLDAVRRQVAQASRVLVALDSDHTQAHVLAELDAYARFVTVGSYCVVFDTIIEDLPADFFPDRSWGPGNNPKTAIEEWLPSNPEFEIDAQIDERLKISVAPNGYLRRVR